MAQPRQRKAAPSHITRSHGSIIYFVCFQGVDVGQAAGSVLDIGSHANGRGRQLQQGSASDQPVAVIVAVADPTASTEDPLTGGIVRASTLHPETCVQQISSSGSSALGPTFDASACQDQVMEVKTSSSTINMLLKVNALITTLPPDVVTATGGASVVYASTPSTIEGSYSVFGFTVDIAADNQPVEVYVKQDALEQAVGKSTAASNMVKVERDTVGPKVCAQHPLLLLLRFHYTTRLQALGLAYALRSPSSA